MSAIMWLERLLEVNVKSDFTSEEKITISRKIREALKELGVNIASTK